MKLKKVNYKIISFALLAILAAAVVCGFVFIKPAYQPSFAVTGDIKNVINVKTMDGFNTYTAVRDAKGYASLKLQDLIAKASPLSSDYTVAIEGDDGLLVQVDGKQTDGMYITFTAQNGWEMINEYHPPSSNVKRITQIWVVSRTEIPGKSVSIISAGKNIAVYSPGQLFMSQTQFAPVFQGTSQKTSGESSFYVSVYTEKRFKRVTDIAPETNDALIMGDDGQYGYDSSPGIIALSGNKLQYVYSDGKTTMDNVRGVLINPPSASNMDAYREAVNNLDSGKRVIIILVDGFGYHQYLYATKNGYAPGLAGLKSAAMATAEYIPVTNTGLAAILTGQPPFATGVWDHGMTDLKVPDIFEYASLKGKTSAYIEGNVKILNTSIEPKLNADASGNGTDDEVFESAQEAASGGADLVFVHFHGTDDAGQTFGDLDTRTMEKVREIDSYISALTKDFQGTVIITADHGMHSSGTAGAHGQFRYEDIIVPYLSYYTGK